MSAERAPGSGARGGGAARLSASPLLVAWLLAGVDALAVARNGTAPRPVLFVALLLAMAYELLIGAVVLAVARTALAFRRFRLGPPLVVVFASLALGAATLPRELAVLAEKLAPGGHVLPTLVVLTAAVSLTVPATALLGRRLGRTRLWWTALPLAALVQLENHAVLERNYPAAHLFLGVLAAVGAAAASWSRLARYRRAERVLAACFGVAGVAGVVASPPSAVLLEILRHEGVGVAPFAAALRTWFARTTRPLPAVPVDGPPRAATRPGLAVSRPVVLFLSVDALRADILATDAASLPHLAELAQGSVRFQVARAPATATMVSLTAMMTSRYYSQQRWAPIRTGGPEFPQLETAPRFTDVLSAAKVATFVVESGLWMRPDYGVLPGFSDRVVVWRDPQPFALAAEVAGGLVEGLRRVGDAPAMLLAHFLDAHAPYDLAGGAGTDRERYVRELAQVDAALGTTLVEVERLGLGDRTVVIVTADHGEAFGEHANSGHGTTIYEEVVRVPIWVRVPGIAPRDETVPVSGIDLGPTIVDVFGLDIPGGFMGETLVPVLLGSGRLPPRAIVVDAGRRQQAMIFPDGYKIIRDLRMGTVELYDLGADPGERHSLYDEAGSAGRAQLEELGYFFDTYTLREGGYEPPVRLP
ncbi:MAG: sulfatase [Polyangiaceae bacterium]|nr:sulfatase [Polyangiaceae bacterium]